MEDDAADDDDDKRPDEDGDEAMETSQARPSQSSPTKAGAQAAELDNAPAKRKKVVISYEKYMALVDMITMQLSAAEQGTGSGLTRHDIETWYLEQREADLNSVEDYEQEQSLIRKVMNKMVKASPSQAAAASADTDIGKATARIAWRIARRRRRNGSRREREPVNLDDSS